MTLPLRYGHDEVWERLNALQTADRLPHALLFCGPPGIGKALLARRFVARLACEGGAAEPCGECAACCQIGAGTHPDLLLIGAPDRTRKDVRRKEIGIAQARELKRFVLLQTVAAPAKLAIVDDADRLSTAAQNALLKTLEEPPGAALLILISASPGALLTTIRSRCQRILFRPLPEVAVRAALVAAGVPVDELDHLVGEADGSPGRALTLRECWPDEARHEVLGLLADLQRGRYGSVLAMSKGFGKSEQETVARLDGLLTSCQSAARRAARGGDSAALNRALRRSEAVAEALRTLRRRNPNRALLGEALALRLARA